MSPPCRKLYWPAGLSRLCPTGWTATHRFRHSACEPVTRHRGLPWVIPTARVAVQVEQVEALRGEQLDDVRRTNRTLIAAAEPHVLYRRPVTADLVGVGRHRVVVE